MIIIPIYLIVYLFIIVFDLMPIKRKKYKGLFALNLATITIAFVIVILVGIEVKVPSPSNFIEKIVRIFIS